MDMLKKIFPLSFKYIKDVPNLIIGIVLYLVAGIVGGVLLGIAGLIPVVGIVVRIFGGLLDLYVLVGIIILLLVYFKIIKD